MTRMISHTETNKLIRKALKAAFPGVKFSVTGSNYSSTNVRWTDGPTEAEVDAVAGFYCSGKGTDWTGDYTVQGTSEFEGETVSFGPTYVFTRRTFSEATKAAAADKAAALMGVEEVRSEGHYGDTVGAVENFTDTRIEDYHAYGDIIVLAVAGVIASAEYAGQTAEEFVAAREAAQVAEAAKWAAEWEAQQEEDAAEAVELPAVSVEEYAETTGETAEVVDMSGAEALILAALDECDPMMYPAFKLLDELKHRGIA